MSFKNKDKMVHKTKKSHKLKLKMIRLTPDRWQWKTFLTVYEHRSKTLETAFSIANNRRVGDIKKCIPKLFQSAFDPHSSTAISVFDCSISSVALMKGRCEYCRSEVIVLEVDGKGHVKC